MQISCLTINQVSRHVGLIINKSLLIKVILILASQNILVFLTNGDACLKLLRESMMKGMQQHRQRVLFNHGIGQKTV